MVDYFFRNYYLATTYVPTDIYPIQYGEQQCRPGYGFGPYVRSNYILHYVYSGGGILLIDDTEYTIHPGEIFLIKPGRRAYYEADSENPWMYRWIEFNGSMSERILSAFTKPVISDYDDGMIGERFKEFISCGKIPFEAAMEKFWAVIAALTVNSAESEHIRSQDYVQMAELYIKNNIDKKITVNDISSHVGINRSYLSRLFKQYKNISPQQYLTTARVNMAAQYLKNTDISIAEVAQSVGYSDYHTFNKVFHRSFNTSPSEWRKKHFWQRSIIDNKHENGG
ncbi:MAG: AraC family transcriptional regulator [Oscillospiraceae bacterium]|nr:AraC family transcriptional regulator [Oscillospiraceae bacterium]